MGDGARHLGPGRQLVAAHQVGHVVEQDQRAHRGVGGAGQRHPHQPQAARLGVALEIDLGGLAAGGRRAVEGPGQRRELALVTERVGERKTWAQIGGSPGEQRAGGRVERHDAPRGIDRDHARRGVPQQRFDVLPPAFQVGALGRQRLRHAVESAHQLGHLVHAARAQTGAVFPGGDLARGIDQVAHGSRHGAGEIGGDHGEQADQHHRGEKDHLHHAIGLACDLALLDDDGHRDDELQGRIDVAHGRVGHGDAMIAQARGEDHGGAPAQHQVALHAAVQSSRQPPRGEQLGPRAGLQRTVGVDVDLLAHHAAQPVEDAVVDGVAGRARGHVVLERALRRADEAHGRLVQRGVSPAFDVSAQEERQPYQRNHRGEKQRGQQLAIEGASQTAQERGRSRATGQPREKLDRCHERQAEEGQAH